MGSRENQFPNPKAEPHAPVAVDPLRQPACNSESAKELTQTYEYIVDPLWVEAEEDRFQDPLIQDLHLVLRLMSDPLHTTSISAG